MTEEPILSSIVAFTVGVGELHSALARVSALCFEACTGIRPVILGAYDLEASDFWHPAALRIDMFSIFPAETIVYFDSYWFLINQWDLSILRERTELIACRDFVLRSEFPLQDYNFHSPEFLGDEVGETNEKIDETELRQCYVAEIKGFLGETAPVSQWINTGLMISNRRMHAPLFRYARDLYLREIGHHNKYYEQPCIQRAICDKKVKQFFLARKYNVLSNREQRWPETVVGLHAKPQCHPTLISALSRPSDPVGALAMVRSIFID